VLCASRRCLFRARLCLSLFFFYGLRPPRDLPSFPTRRSSDLRALHARRGAIPLAQLWCAAREPARVGAVRPCEGLRLEQALGQRSKEHTSELQSRFDLVCRLLLEKKKKHKETGTDPPPEDALH